MDRRDATIVTTPAGIARIYYTLVLGNTLAASLIWGINTLFLLDAGLSNLEAFAANAFFTAGMVLFEVPTGVVADMRGRRVSFLLGTLTLAGATALYVGLWAIDAPFWQWAIVSVLLGLGFTFFSGATEAWLVDALQATGYRGSLETVFGRGQVITGVATLVGSAGGGFLAQATNLAVPFILRAGVLVVMFAVAFVLMRDLGFTPAERSGPIAEMRQIMSASVRYGWRVPAVRDLMLAGAFTGGVSIYAFYALQPYLLDLWGDPEAYGVAGVAAAVLSAAQIAGGLLAPRLRRLFTRRTSALLLVNGVAAASMVAAGLAAQFYVVMAVTVVWGMVFAAGLPIRQAYLNGSIPSRQRATILSFDSLVASSGGVVAQPALGRAADVWGYPATFVASGVVAAIALPFLAHARTHNAPGERD
jgi:MFS family permease